ncbi:MAG: DNA polymerase III subunit [Planctomycetota bacterium]|nr:DNA polymerase III subunit [Planctomycetota bacterium]
MQNILGQSHAIETLQGTLKSGRLHHAWIFSGPRGVGKFTTALEFARILLDPEAQPNLAGQIDSDPSSETSKLIEAGSHPDLHIIRKELALFSDNPMLRSRKLMNIPLDLLREHMLGGRTSDDRRHEAAAYRTPKLGHRKVFIVDEAELIDKNGQNSMLKTLEEPPAQTFLILVSSRGERLLPTIRSRCQHVRFHRLDLNDMEAWFNRSELGVDEDERKWLLRFADGSPGQAHLAAEFRFYEWRRILNPMIAQLEKGNYPSDMGKAMAELIKGFSEAWVKSRKNASKDAANKDGARHLFSLLASYARARLQGLADDEMMVEHFASLIELIREAELQLDFNVNARHVLDNLVVQWSRLGALTPA